MARRTSHFFPDLSLSVSARNHSMTSLCLAGFLDKTLLNAVQAIKATCVFRTPHAYWGYRIVRDLLVNSKKATSMTFEIVRIMMLLLGR